MVLPPTSQTQAHKVAKHLLDRGSISFIEALHQYRITSLTKVISVLKQLYDYPIRSEWRSDETNKRYVRYFLEA